MTTHRWFWLSAAWLCWCGLPGGVRGHWVPDDPHHGQAGDPRAERSGKIRLLAAAPPDATSPAPARVTGQGNLRFKVLSSSTLLPEQAQAVLRSAHGGFAVDRRPGKGQTYFALPGAGIIRLGADLRSADLLPTPAEVRNVNLHNSTIWRTDDGEAYLTFPANDAGKVFTTTLDGRLVHLLPGPRPGQDFDEPIVDAYWAGSGKFAPTDVEYLDGRLYVTTGYSPLDYVLTARVWSTAPFHIEWTDLAFGGRGDGPGKFGTGHGITVVPGGKHLMVADRPNSELDRFTRYGHYRGSLALPKGAWPCDIDYENEYAVVGCLHGPDRQKGAPIYLLQNQTVVSTLLPREDLGLEQFTHIHNAVLRRVGNKLHIIAQAWNPGDFVVLEQVSE